jgi:hypothetical protein
MPTQVLVVIFGQELPEATASLASQVFGLCVALVGLATFALVLALLQQVMTCTCSCMHCTQPSVHCIFRVTSGQLLQNKSLVRPCESMTNPMMPQVVLEVIDENVAQGSRVYEEGHVSVMTSCRGTWRLSSHASKSAVVLLAVIIHRLWQKSPIAMAIRSWC